MKTLLVVGNGFDLAHGLPTSYADFLDFSCRLMRIYTYMVCDDEKLAKKYFEKSIATWGEDDAFSTARSLLKENLIKYFDNRTYNKIDESVDLKTYKPKVHVNDRMDLFYGYLNENIWYKYINNLYRNGKARGKNWIDFESEISYIIELIDSVHNSLEQSVTDVLNLCNKYESEHSGTSGRMKYFNKSSYNFRKKVLNTFNEEATLGDFREKLYNDLENLILAFEIYLTDCVETMPIKGKINVIERLMPDYVISFNYTKTYENHYIDKEKNTKVCHIHGICDRDSVPANNNMVLGVDEYLPEDKRTVEVDFCIFKKFVQRIRKHNDVTYASWLKEIEETKPRSLHEKTSVDQDAVLSDTFEDFSDIYFFGHSLDITDKDILRRFVISAKTRIHIFARNKSSEGELIAKLIRMAGEEIVIKKSTTDPPMIEFLLTRENKIG